MRMLAQNELEHVFGAASEETVDFAKVIENSNSKINMKLIEWKPDHKGSWLATWTPNGDFAQDAWEGLAMIGFFCYKHSTVIVAGVCSIFGARS